MLPPRLGLLNLYISRRTALAPPKPYMVRRTRASAAKESAVEASKPAKAEAVNGAARSEIASKTRPRSPSAEKELDNETKEPPKKKTKTTRKKKEPTDYAVVDFPLRTVFSSTKVLGFHASTSGGVELACINSLKQGATGFALFLKNQRQWASKPLSEENLRLFPLYCAGQCDVIIDGELDPKTQNKLGDGKGFNRFNHIIPHGSYLVNLGNPTPDKWQKAFDGFLDELQRAEQLGIAHLNIHPGSSTGVCTREEAISSIAKGINLAHEQTSSVVVLLENMAAKGNLIGGPFEDLADIIAQVKDKSRIGVTFDTCHAFAYGHDLRTPEAVEQTLSAFDRIIGLKYLKALHVNDSKGEFESHRDLHENIGCGKIGLVGFGALMADDRLNGLPLILETPDVAPDDANYKVEIELLHRLEVVARSSTPDRLALDIEGDAELQERFQWLQKAVEAKDMEKKAKKITKKKSQEKTAKKTEESDNDDAEEEF